MRKAWSSPTFRRIVLWTLSVGFLLMFVWLAIRFDTLALLGQLDPLLVLILIALSVLYLLQRVLATKILLRGMGYDVPFKGMYLAITASLPTNYTTPAKVGVPIRLALFKEFLGIPVSVGMASVFMETALGLVIAAIIAFFGTIHLFRHFLPGFEVVMLLLMAGIVVMYFLPIPAVSRPSHRFLGKYLQRMTDFVTKFRDSIRLTSRSTLLVIVVLQLMRIVIRTLATYAILLQFNVNVSMLALLYIQAISGTIGMLSMLPMGLGARDLSSVVLMTQIGVPGDVAVLAAAMDRLLWTLVPFGLGVVSVNALGNRWLQKAR
jgi:uncharacterized protein (TIRG00374 family)